MEVTRGAWRDGPAAQGGCTSPPATMRHMPPQTWVEPVILEGTRVRLEAALANAEAGTERPFATIDLASGRAVGSSRHMSIVPEHRRLEIGWTWIGSAFQRTGANRVEFKTHARNDRSRIALAGIGATFEGIFRQHMVMPDGSLRDSAWFSVITDEWPAVKARLQAGGRTTN